MINRPSGFRRIWPGPRRLFPGSPSPNRDLAYRRFRSCEMSDLCPPGKKKLYIETVGCQMNVLDSELVVGKLRNEGYELTDDINEADTILYNTCSVRQHAEDKIYSALGRVRSLKQQKPGLTIGVLGCMAQKDQGQIL